MTQFCDSNKIQTIIYFIIYKKTKNTLFRKTVAKDAKNVISSDKISNGNSFKRKKSLRDMKMCY